MSESRNLADKGPPRKATPRRFRRSNQTRMWVDVDAKAPRHVPRGDFLLRKLTIVTLSLSHTPCTVPLS